MPKTRLWAFVAAFVALSVRAGSLYGQSCGSTITKSTTLHANLGPCSGDGLFIGASNIILNLNGFSITGPGTPMGVIGVWVLAGNTGVKINGPGIITGFDQGILLDGLTDGSRVTQVQLLGNFFNGIEVGSNTNTIINNTVSSSACYGIKVGNNNNQLTGNAIRGATDVLGSGTCATENEPPAGGTGIWIVVALGTVVRNNTVNASSNGLFTDGFSSGTTIANNDFSGNTQDGLTSQGQATMTSNQANGNGRDGISIAQGSGSVIQSNTANSNGRRGIGLGDLLGAAAGSNNSITSNRTLGNVTDLFWDGAGTGNCWKNNIFDTSSGALPVCP